MKRPDDNARAIGAALIALTAFGAAVRWIVAGQDLFADELATYWIVSTNGLPGVVDTVSTTAEISPPLGFMLTWLSTRIDLVPELVRLPALIAGIGTIPLVYAVGVRTVGRGAALAAAAFTALSPFMIFYSAEARGYGVMMAFVLLSTLALLHAIDDGRRRWWVAYAIFVALAAYTHYTSIFVLGAQFVWALWRHPSARRPLLIATAAAAIVYIPWLPSLKGDLDSPTTDILGALLPFNLGEIRTYVGTFLLGYPLAQLRDIPGAAGLSLAAAGLACGAAGLYTLRGRIKAWFAANDNRILLVIGLALVTPLAEAVASLLSTNVFSTRNLAASWPFVALTVAALITAGQRLWLRAAAAAGVILALGLGTAKALTADYQRPDFSGVAQFAAAEPGGVVVDAAAFTPGPLANFDVEGSDPGVMVFRLNVPEQKRLPFSLRDQLPDPTDLAERAVDVADGGPVTVVTAVGINTFRGRVVKSDLAEEFIAELPPEYHLVDREVFTGFLDLEARVYSPDAEPELGS